VYLHIVLIESFHGAIPAVIFLVLIGGIVTTMWQAQQAERNAQEAEQVSAFLAQVFEGSDPNRANDGSMTARELLDQGFERAKTELTDEPGLQAQMLSMIGNIYSNLGLYDDAYLAIEKSVELFHNIEDRSPKMATALLRLANLEYRLDNFEAAAETAKEALELNIEHYGETHAETASVMNTLAMSLEEIGEKDEAYSMYYRIIEIRRDQPEQGSNLAVNLNNLAILLQEDGKLDEADALFSEAVDLIGEVLGTEHPFMAYILNGYSGLHQDRGNFDQAENHLMQALEIGQAIFPETHPFIGVVQYNLGELFRIMENYTEAADYYLLSLEQRKQSLPDNHPDIANTLYSLGGVLIETDRPDLAEIYLLDAVRLRKEIYEPDDRRIALAEARLGKCLLYQRKMDEAEPLLLKSYTLLRELLGEDDLITQEVLADLDALRLR